MVNTTDSPQSSFEEKNEGQEISSENVEIQTEEQSVEKEPDCAIDEQPEVETQEELQIEPEASPDKTPELSEIKDLLIDLSKQFESKLKYDKHKDEIISKLHAENQSYKNDLLKKTVKPVFMDMIVFADSMKSLVSYYEETPETDLILEKYQKLRKEFIKVESHIRDLIYNYGIEPFSSQPNDEFNPKTQQVRKDTLTDDPEKHKKIVESLSSGYIWDDQLLRRESVNIFKHEPEKTNN